MFEDLSARTKLDEEEIARLRKERDKLLQKNTTASEKASELLAELQTERDLKLKAEERSTMLQEKANQDAAMIDRTIRERDKARREAKARQADLGVEVTRRLDAEEVSASLRTDLAEVRGLLQAESDGYDRLSLTVMAVCDNLQVAQEEGTSSLAARAASVTARVGQLEESAFHAGITQAFTVAHAHYEKEINLKVMSEGFSQEEPPPSQSRPAHHPHK